MNRRTFCRSFFGLVGAISCGDIARAQPAITATVTFAPPAPHSPILSSNVAGLSFEKSRIGIKDFFSEANVELVRLFSLLTPQGTLRIGGFSSDQSCLTTNSASDYCKFKFNEVDLQRLGRFLKRTGWRLLYGANAVSISVQDAVSEVSALSRSVGDKLEAVQYGNEPDLYRKQGYKRARTISEYGILWGEFEKRINNNDRGVNLAGPDVASSNEWLSSFLQRYRSSLRYVTRHYYALGPASRSDLSTYDLLHSFGSRAFLRLGESADIAKRADKEYMLTEVNSVYGGTARGGGLPGVSDTFASALWAAEFLARTAGDGWRLVCFHSGFRDPSTAIRYVNGKCTPTPLYVGMLFFSLFQLKECVVTNVHGDLEWVSAFACAEESEFSIMLINKSRNAAATVDVALNENISALCSISLAAPSLESREGVTLGGASITADGHIALESHLIKNVKENRLVVRLGAHTAILLSTLPSLKKKLAVRNVEMRLVH